MNIQAALAFLAGVLITGAVAFATRPTPEPCPIPTPCPVCAPAPEAAAPAPAVDPLSAAQAEVTKVKDELVLAEAALAKALAEADKATDQKDVLAAKARQLEKDVGTLKAKLNTATQERDRVVAELKETLAKLDDQIGQTQAARAEAAGWKSKTTDQAWQRFVAQAKVEICEKGTAKKHEQCGEAVADALRGDIQRRFRECVDTGQAEPSLGQVEKANAPPRHAILLPEDKRLTGRGWYVQLCDPSLPEAKTP